MSMTTRGAMPVSQDRILAADTLLFYDDFESGAGLLIGRTPRVGSAWTAMGAGAAAAAVGSGYVSAAANTYCVASMASTPYSYGGVFEVTSGTVAATLACMLAADSLNDMIHPTAGSTGAATLYWKTGTGTSLVVAGGSTDTWTALAINTKYRVNITLDAPYLTLTLEALDGTPIGTAESYEPNMASIIGPNAFFQLNGSNVRWHEVWAYGRPTASGTSKRFARFVSGIEATTIGRFFPASSRFRSSHVGRGSQVGTALLSARHDSSDNLAPTFAGTGTGGLVKIVAESAGHIANLWLQNGAGGIAKMVMDGSYVHYLLSNGAAWLSKPWMGDPYFAAGVRIGGSAGPHFSGGAGTPEGAVVGSIGDIFLRTDGGASTTLYVKTSGTDTKTGWTAK